MRIDKHNYYLDIAERVLSRSTCRRRKFGAIIVKNDEVVATGYAGAPRGRKNCNDQDMPGCVREKLNIPRGTRYELCRSVHAEQNAIISAARKDMIGSTMYIVGIALWNDNPYYCSHSYVEGAEPCAMCKRIIINAGIDTVIVRDTNTVYRTLLVQDWIANDESLNISVDGAGY